MYSRILRDTVREHKAVIREKEETAPMIIVSLIGLKKCGKTTTAEALISEFKKRGFRVGAVKVMPHSTFTIDTEGKDTWRQKQAGADFVISLSKDEMAYIEKKEGRAKLTDALRLVPQETDILICEGLTEDDPRISRIVLAKSMDLLKETFRVRGIETRGEEGQEGKGAKIIALSGIMANEAREHPDYPVFNCTEPEGVKGLADLIIEKGGGN